MKHEDGIHEGDRVDVTFVGSSGLFNCMVIQTPCAAGDSWVLKTEDGKPVYVQMFERMEKR